MEVILFASAIIIAAGDDLPRPSSTFVIGIGVVGVVAIFVFFFIRITGVSFVDSKLTSLVHQLFYIGV